jgi:hypothetical protein
MNRSMTAALRVGRPVRWACFLAIAAAFGAGPLAAQIPDRAQTASDGDTAVYEVRLEDGSVLYGRFVAVEGPRVVLVTEAGATLELTRAQIRVARRVARDGVGAAVGAGTQFETEDPSRQQLFFGPTGRSLKAGEGYAGTFEMVFPFVGFALTDHVTIAGGTPIIPVAMGRTFYLAPRLQLLRTEAVQLSASALAFFDLEHGGDAGGLLLGAATFGSSDQGLTLGAAWGFAGDEIVNQPVFQLGGDLRISERVKLLTENYYVGWEESGDGYYYDNDDDILLMGAGLRFISENATADVGLGFGDLGLDEDFMCCLPLVNIVYHFGSGR